MKQVARSLLAFSFVGLALQSFGREAARRKVLESCEQSALDGRHRTTVEVIEEDGISSVLVEEKRGQVYTKRAYTRGERVSPLIDPKDFKIIYFDCYQGSLVTVRDADSGHYELRKELIGIYIFEGKDGDTYLEVEKEYASPFDGETFSTAKHHFKLTKTP